MIERILIVWLFLYTFVVAEVYEISNFQSDIFSKDGNKLKKVTLSLRMEGRDLNENSYKVRDALNIIISSFYLEDLFTSKGKEGFKQALRQYLSTKYKIQADQIYLNKFKITPTPLEISELIDALKAEGCCVKSNNAKKVFDTIQE